MTPDELQDLKDDIAKAEARASRAEGAIETIRATLKKDFEVEPDEAGELLETLRDKHRELQRDYEEGVARLKAAMKEGEE